MRAYMRRRARYILARNTAERALADLCAHIVRACTTSAAVLLKSVNSTHARLHRVDRKAWLCKSTLLVATQLESACAVRTDFERPGTMSRARPRSLLAWIHRSTAWWMGLGGARKGDARGERSVWVVPLHRLAPSYQFSHRDYGRPSQNFVKSSTYPFLTQPPTPLIPSDPRCDATPRTSIPPKSGRK